MEEFTGITRKYADRCDRTATPCVSTPSSKSAAAEAEISHTDVSVAPSAARALEGSR